MSRLAAYLEKSRLAAVIEQAEKGEPVDYPRVAALQALDLARVGELFALDALDREAKVNDEFAKLDGT